MINIGANEQQFNQDNNYISFDVEWTAVLWDINLMSLCETGNFGIAIQSMNLYDLDNIDLTTYESSVYDWWWLYGNRYSTRLLSISLFIQESSHDNLVKTIDNLKKKTLWESNFIIKWRWYSETKRQQRAVLRWLTFGSIWQQDYIADVSMDILLLDWYWTEVDDIKKLVVNVDDTTINIINNVWWYDSYPKIYITCWETGNAMTWVDIEIRVLWQTIWHTISIYEEITNEDVVILDYINKEVLLNNVPIPYYWPMTPLTIWNNEVVITPTGTINASITISYYKTWL